MPHNAFIHQRIGDRDDAVHRGGLAAAAPRARTSQDLSSHDNTLLFSIDEYMNSKASSCFQSPAKEGHRTGIGSFWPEGSSLHEPDSLHKNVLLGCEACIQVLKQDVLSILNDAESASQHDQNAEFVASSLAKAGWNVLVLLERSQEAKRKAASVPAMPFKPFLLVTGYTWGSVASETTDVRAVVELSFRSQFELSLQRDVSKSYRSAQEHLPEVFVGTPSELRNTVIRMCRKMKQEFAAKDMSLPPWRAESSILARWFPLEHRKSRQFAPPHVHLED